MSVNEIDVNAVNARASKLSVVEAGRLGGQKGGKSTSEAKKKALQENLKKAREAKKLKYENNHSNTNPMDSNRNNLLPNGIK